MTHDEEMRWSIAATLIKCGTWSVGNADQVYWWVKGVQPPNAEVGVVQHEMDEEDGSL